MQCMHDVYKGLFNSDNMEHVFGLVAHLKLSLEYIDVSGTYYPKIEFYLVLIYVLKSILKMCTVCDSFQSFLIFSPIT